MPCGGRWAWLWLTAHYAPAQVSTAQLAGVLARVLRGDSLPSLGPFSTTSPEDTQVLKGLRQQLEPQWKMLQVVGEQQGRARQDPEIGRGGVSRNSPK